MAPRRGGAPTIAPRPEASFGSLLGSGRVKTFLVRLMLLAISFGFAMVIFEIALRVLMGPPVVYVFPQESYLHDAGMGHTLEPGDRAYTHDQPVRVNDFGLRGPDIEREVAPGTRRVLALGDSQTFGNGVAEEATWPFLLEEQLTERFGGTRWQVLNAGISGTDTWQHAMLLARLADTLEFDAVVLAFYVNDVVRRSELAEVELTNSWSKRVGYVLKRSAFFTFAWQTWNRATAPASTGEFELGVLRGATSPALDAAWAQVEASLGEMQALCRERDIPFVVVVLPRRDQVMGTEAGRAYGERVVQIAAQHGIGAVDLLPPFERAHDEHGIGLFIPWDGHNTALANEVVAVEIVDAFGVLLDGRDRSRD